MIKNISTAQHYRWGDACDGWRLLNRPNLSVMQERIPPGAGEVSHFKSDTCGSTTRESLTIAT